MEWVSETGEVATSCAVFFKVTEEFGGLSNMAGGWPLRVNGILIGSSEALYQACRFPHRPDWQKEIIIQASPMSAKMKAKKEGRRDRHSRPDWDVICVEVMRWVLRVKLAQYYLRMKALFQQTAGRSIAEKSRKDRFWGAVEEDDGRLHGRNELGRLLMELRQQVESRPREEFATVEPMPIADFLLLGKPIEAVKASDRVSS
jgi:ribA/ribD-fused uncharacterized protein